MLVERHKTLFYGLRVHDKNRIELVHPVAFLARRLVYAFVAVFCLGWWRVQVAAYISASLVMLCILHVGH